MVTARRKTPEPFTPLQALKSRGIHYSLLDIFAAHF